MNAPAHREIEPLLHPSSARLQRENEALAARCLDLEDRLSQLSRLYAAVWRLSVTDGRGDALLAIKEIVANLVGSEHAAVFEMAADGSGLRYVDGIGLDPDCHVSDPLDSRVIGASVRSREIYVASGPASPTPVGDGEPQACVPLLDGEVVVGVLVVYRLLMQKSGFDAADHRLFDVLATHAGRALARTRPVQPAEPAGT